MPQYPESIRDQLPRDETFPLRREDLNAALEQAGVERVDLVYFLRHGITDWRSSSAGRLLSINYRAQDRLLRSTDRIEIRVHAVPGSTKPTVASALPSALSQAAEWIRAAERSENAWRSSDHALTVRWEHDSVHVDEQS